MARFWSEREEELLRKFYPHLGDSIEIEELEKMFNRRKEAIRCKARNLGLKGGYGKEDINEEIRNQLEARIEI